MAVTLQDILLDSAAFLDLEATLPTDDELQTRARYADIAVKEAAEISVLPELHKEYVVATTSSMSISLPVDFKELEAAAFVLDSSGGWTPYYEIKAEDKYTQGLSDKYCYILGNRADGYTAVVNQLESGATISFPYQRCASGLVTLTDTCELNDSDYVVTKVNAYVLKSRGDDRFPIMEAEAQTKLKNMVGRTQKRPSGGTGSVPKSINFSIGGD